MDDTSGIGHFSQPVKTRNQPQDSTSLSLSGGPLDCSVRLHGSSQSMALVTTVLGFRARTTDPAVTPPDNQEPHPGTTPPVLASVLSCRKGVTGASPEPRFWRLFLQASKLDYTKIPYPGSQPRCHDAKALCFSVSDNMNTITEQTKGIHLKVHEYVLSSVLECVFASNQVLSPNTQCTVYG